LGVGTGQDARRRLSRRLFDAYNERAGDAATAQRFCTPEAIFEAVSAQLTYRMGEGLASMLADLEPVWETNSAEWVQAERIGDQLLVEGLIRGRPRTVGGDIEQPYWYLLEFERPGLLRPLRISRARLYADRSAAVAAAG
jgi:hypothetical protein